ncbi:MAG: DUF1501 domain-containing protein [Acetobacteraceae bacterium]|nr:DUF1501 domain-containing protein [Acetobacteraceae bacterium]
MAHLPIGRRGLILGLATSLVAGRSRAALADAPGERRLVVVLLRGALDGLSTVAPYADPRFAELRGPLALPEPGREGGLLDLGGSFGLHPAMPGLHRLFAANEAAFVHAAAGPWRTRSHFDGQDFLESGADHRLAAGWLNRAVLALWPHEAGAIDSVSRKALAAGQSVPLLLRGEARITNWVPRNLPATSPDAMTRLAGLYRRDPLLGPVFADAEAGRHFAQAALAGAAAAGAGGERAGFAALMRATGRLLADPRGPRVAATELTGFDTHAGQVPRLPNLLGTLDAGIEALREALGPAWTNTAVLAMTEFGRTVRINGTGGTDHGTGGVAILAGGAIAGGRVFGNWPGLGDLLEGRDLAPTTDLRALAKALLGAHLGVPASRLDREVFPGSAGVAPMRGLLRA